MGPWAEQLVIFKLSKTEVCPQPDKKDMHFPSSINIEGKT